MASPFPSEKEKKNLEYFKNKYELKDLNVALALSCFQQIKSMKSVYFFCVKKYF